MGQSLLTHAQAFTVAYLAAELAQKLSTYTAMPRPFYHDLNDWLFSRLRLRYVLAVLVVFIAAVWLADGLGWLPAPVVEQAGHVK